MVKTIKMSCVRRRLCSVSAVISLRLIVVNDYFESSLYYECNLFFIAAVRREILEPACRQQ